MKKQQMIERQMRAVQVIMEALDPLDPVSREAALKMAMVGLAFELPSGATAAPAGAAAPAADEASSGVPSPRSFVRAKNPLSDVERVVCLAYYLTHYENRKTFRNRDLVRVNAAADGPQMNMRMAAQNAMRQNGYLASAAGVARQITTRGEKVVEALPDRDAVKQALLKHPKPPAGKQRSGKRRVA